MTETKRWLHEWWITLRYGSRLTRAGRELRRNLQDGPESYIEVERPCRGRNSNACVAEGCYGEACLTVGRDA